MNIPEHIFREYDIRGNVGEDLHEDFAHLLGRAYAQLAKESGKNQIAIGFDARESSEPYANALARGISGEGLDCEIIGLCPTPQLYWTIYDRKLGGGIQITGSHNPSHMNGFKICLGERTLSGDEIRSLRPRMIELENSTPSETPGSISENLSQQQYISDLTSRISPHMGDRKLKVVVDAGNGVAGLTGPQLLKNLGVEVAELYCDPDGSFPNHHPDPTVPEYMQDLIQAVQSENADFGIGWDGDGDRIGVVDNNGKLLFGDTLGILYARAILEDAPGSTFIADVRCSSLFFDEIQKLGGNTIMWKAGHSLIKKKLKETEAALAAEMSGHIFFGHRYYGFDDGTYCAARLCEILSNTNSSLSELLSDLPEMASTPEIRLDCPEEKKFRVAEQAKGFFSEYEVETIDGIRIQFPDGWGLVRPSNTQPALSMRFEAKTEEKLKEYQSLVQSKIDQIIQSL